MKPEYIFDECHARYRSCGAYMEGMAMPLGQEEGDGGWRPSRSSQPADYRADFEKSAKWVLPEQREINADARKGLVNPHAAEPKLRRLFELYVVQDPLDFEWHHDPLERTVARPAEVHNEKQRKEERGKGKEKGKDSGKKAAAKEKAPKRDARQEHYRTALAGMGVRADVFDHWWGDVRARVGAELERRGIYPLGKYFSEPAEGKGGRAERPERPRVCL